MSKQITATGIDLAYRPHSYFWAADSGIRLASDITGANRRQMYYAALHSGQHEVAEALMATPVLDYNFDTDGYPRDAVHGFITDASSSFYADFGLLIEERVDAWLDEKHAAL